MNTLSIRLRYRPLRLGWCVLKDDMEAFRQAVRLSFTMWGGRFNPILPVDDASLARALVKLFRVDALVPLSRGGAVDAFLAAHKHLPWPMIGGGDLFVRTMNDGKAPAIVDISHPVHRLHEEFVKNNPTPEAAIDIYEWEAADPLADVFLCSMGALPSHEQTGVHYLSLLQTALLGARSIIRKDAEVQAIRIGRYSIASLNRALVEKHYVVRNHWNWPGFYVGDANCFTDLVSFWNLRAADIPLMFFDASYVGRLRAIATQWTAIIRQEPEDPLEPERIALWHQRQRTIDDPKNHFGDGAFTQCTVDDGIWNGLNVKAPIMYFGSGTALASIDAGGRRETMSFALTDKPFADHQDAYHQHYVLSVDPGIGLFRNEQATLHFPFIPELNGYYGRDALAMWITGRAEPDSFGIVSSVSDEHQTIRALNSNELIVEIFRLAGIDATPSKPGLIASTLIQQMGGLGGCRAFKIAGVRTLIETHRPQQSFDRGTAMQIILGRGADRPLSEYQWLYIEPRKSGVALKNSDVLSYLLEKGVFRAGLRFECPNCRLEFWRSLDDSGSRLECEYCGHNFNAAPQLRDKAWAFRRSGLFGNDDHQEGAIPVLLALQTLTRMTGTRGGVFTTAMALKPKVGALPECEADFVVMAERGRDQRIQIAIGEAKTRKPITAKDVANLKAIAGAFPSDRFDVYVVFARLTPFSIDEVELIKQVNDKYHNRAIMLTDRELEPYFTYERTAKEFDISETAVSFEDMVTATTRVFFEQRKRDPNIKAVKSPTDT